MNNYYSDIIDKVYSSDHKMVAIRHYNDWQIGTEELAILKKEKPNVVLLYKNFAENRIAEPFDPFLEWIKELCVKNSVSIEELLDECDVYSLHKEILSSYLKTGLAKRKDKPLINEIEFERELFEDEIIRLFVYLAHKTEVCAILDNASVAGISTLVILQKLFELSDDSIAIICSYNENDTDIDGTKEIWNSIVESWEDNDLLLDVLGEDVMEYHRNRGFRCFSDLLRKDLNVINNLFHFMCFSQAEHYLSTYYHKFEVEKLIVEPNVKFEFTELYANVSMYMQKNAEALLCLNDMQKLLEVLIEDNWKLRYHKMAAKIYMHNFQQDRASEHIKECKKILEGKDDEEAKFEIELLEHMVFFQGWRDIWLLNRTLEGLEPLISKCIKYGYDNHLAHIYVYAYDNESERYANLAGMGMKMPHFMKGIKIAQKIGNYHFMIEAYKKNVLLASTNGYYNTANYFNEKVKEICIRYNQAVELANSYNGLGYNCSVMEMYEKASENYNNALDIFLRENDMNSVNETIYNLAVNSILATDYAKADSLFQLCIKCIALIKANSVNACNISKIYGLRAFCNYKLGHYYNAMINLQYVEQFLGHIIELENNDVNAPHLWDDDLAIFYTVSALMDERDGKFEKAYEKVLNARKYVDRAAGSRFMFLTPYALVFARIARRIGHKQEAVDVINEAKRFCRENNFKQRGEIIVSVENGEPVKPKKLDIGIKCINEEEIIERARYIGMSIDYKSQKVDLEFLGIWQKVLGENYQNMDRVLDNAFVTFVNQYNLDDFLFIRMEDERPILKYKICDKDISDDVLWDIVDYFNERRNAFITSRLDKGYTKYQNFINKCFGFNSISTFIAVPIFSNERLDSVFLASVQMNMEWNYKSKRYLFDNNDLAVFSMLYHNVIDYINRMDAQKMIANANKRLQTMAVNDQLTGIYNRQGLDNIYANDFDKIAIVYADLDNFKYYNDTFGHDVGDKVLVEFAKLLGQVTDQRADAVRYGGDEFLLILYTDDKNIVDGAVKNIYKRLVESEGLAQDISKSLGYEINIPKDKRLSCSIGIAMGSVDKEHDKKEQIAGILKKADTMMYRVKHSTKNSYMYYDY